MRLLAGSMVLSVTLVLGACGLLPETPDETAGWSAQRLYNEAKSEMGDANYEKAIKLYEKLESRYPFGRYAQQAQLEIAYAHFKNREPALALSACDRFIKLHPNHPNVDYAYYLKGLVNFNEDLGLLGYIANQDPSERDSHAARESFDSLKELVNRFPESRYARDAEQRLKYLVNNLSAYEVHVARYYMRRGAYVAAANRAQTAVKDFPETPPVEEALYILVKAYEALGMSDLRDDAERVMRKNFPNSAFLARGFADKGPWWKLW